MTEEEKDRLREAKKRVTSSLLNIPVDEYRLSEVDPRLQTYVEGVISEPEKHNLWEQLAVERFFRLADKYGINATEVRKFIIFYEHLHFPGKGGDQCYKMTPVQVFQFTNIYGFWKEDGHRVIQEVILFLPRKFSKTTSAAAMPLYDLFYGDSNAEDYIGANSNDQAKKCFDVIRGCMRHLDPRERRYAINEQTIKSKRRDRSAFAQCLTANARTKDGLNASTIVMDEFSQAQDAELYNVLTTSMGVRDNPLTVIITTASDVFDGPFYEMLQGYKEILLGTYEDDSVFIHLFEPDVDDDEGAEETWWKVHPHMGVTVSIDFYRREYAKALRNGSEAMLAFRTKLLNIYAENEMKAWISSTIARRVARTLDISKLKGRPEGMVSIDLSESDDFSAVSVGFYDPTHKDFVFHTAYFFPEGALRGHPNERMYRLWVEKGYLILTDGDVIDYRKIVEYILELNKYIKILQIGYDPYKSTEVVNMLAASGAKKVLIGVRQTYGNFTAPVESFEHAVKTGHAFIDDNPINFFCFGNAVLDFDKLENCKPIKRTHNMKIDGVITILMCMRLFIDFVR